MASDKGRDRRSKRPQPLPLVFDTSVLRGLNLNGPEFGLLRKHSEVEKVSLLVPEIAFREWLSQRAESSMAVVKRLDEAFAAVRKDKSLKDQSAAKHLTDEAIWSESLLSTLRQQSTEWHATP